MVKPKKHLGQHFLTDQNIARKIVEALSGSTSNVLEIGPGKGVLTKYLIDIPEINIKAVELDSESVEYLNSEYPDLEVLASDFLKMDLNQIFDGEALAIIGNFPYNISSQIVFKALENRDIVNELVGMFQKEVAARIAAPPGNKDYGILSVLSQIYFECEYLFTVPPGVFFPPPKVKSGVIRMTRKENEPNGAKYSDMAKLVKMAFNQRRKKLSNSISALLPSNFKHEYLDLRPEQLSWQQFVELNGILQKSA